MLKVLENKVSEQGEGHSTLDEIAREGARRMLVEALHAEVADYVEQHRGERDEEGRALVVRNGRARKRSATVGSGTLEVEAPRVDDRRAGEHFTSRILPPYMRRSPKVAEVLPLLYLRGLSTGDFREALPVLLGEEATGLSPTAITRLVGQWEQEYTSFRKRDLSAEDYIYTWVDGVHFRVRLEEDRLCTLVVLGVRRDGTKELLAVEDGYRESAESWSSVLRDLKRRGMKAPLLAIGDGALGFWKAACDVWPETQEQRCWVHRLANVLDKLPKRLQAKAKRALHDIMNAETLEDAEEEIDQFAKEYGAKYPKAVESLQREQDALLAFFDFPAEHWKHIRSTNAIESSFATVRLRTRVTKGAGSRNRALVMAFKLLAMAEARWRKIDAPHLAESLALGARFKDGIQIKEDAKEAA
ncbi:MAG: IS256 family transposase [Deltaproteobacteria bacterium]|nr:IS256 family transposase [Deltaproteobacteria bacterium]